MLTSFLSTSKSTFHLRISLLISCVFLSHMVYAQRFTAQNSKDQTICFKVNNVTKHEVSVVKSRPKYSYSNIIIPETVEYNGITYTVTIIDTEAFEECENLKEISLPQTIRVIKDSAFENCEFDSFDFPKNLEKIEQGAFSWSKIGKYCDYFAYMGGKSITSPRLKGEYKLARYEGDGIVKLKNFTTGKTLSLFFLPVIDMETDVAYKIAEEKLKMALDDIESQIYMPKLSKVERTDDPENRFSGVKEVETDSTNWYGFSDDNIEATINFRKYCFELKIKNKSSNTIKIVWDEAVYVDPNGESSALSPGETRIIDNEKAKLASTIIRGTTSSQILVPNCNILEKGKIRFKRLLPTDDTKSFADKHIVLMIPIKIKDVINEYVFDFEIVFNDKIGVRQ